jgi:alpha-glucosidase
MAAAPRAAPPVRWWDEAVIYQVYVRSFCDSNGDGIGDLPGLTSRLDYLAWLGVDAIWCSPIGVSANRDHGYDVVDYCDVDPRLGTLDDVDRLVAEAGRRGIRVLLDFVPNHTSIDHPWFADPERKRDWYVWTSEPNNWMSSFHVPTWTFDDDLGLYYLHSYSAAQPDLNWWNEDVRAEFDRILRFWFDRGIAGFRIDACYMVVKDRWLRDNPAAGPADHPWDLNRGQRPVYNAHRPELHDVLRRWRAIADGYTPQRLLLGATWMPDTACLARYYGDDDQLQLAQNYLFPCERLRLPQLRDVVESWLDALGERRTPVWLGSCHDHLGRLASRWCDGDERKIRVVLTLLLTLPGSCILYQGDEIGLEDTPVPDERVRDIVQPPRDGARTPMPWSAATGGGFTSGTPWLPLGDVERTNVDRQRRDRGSLLHLTRRLIALKKRLHAPYSAEPDPRPGHWSFRRGDVRVDLDFDRWTASVADTELPIAV